MSTIEIRKPVIEWRISTPYAFRDGLAPYEYMWDGDLNKLERKWLLENFPHCGGKIFAGSLKGVVGDLEIGEISMFWAAHLINWPPRLCINSYSIFDTKKRRGSYGKDFNDEFDIKDRTLLKRSASLDDAKAYIEQLFMNLVDKAHLVQKII